jgi:hypothetical protein
MNNPEKVMNKKRTPEITLGRSLLAHIPDQTIQGTAFFDKVPPNPGAECSHHHARDIENNIKRMKSGIYSRQRPAETHGCRPKPRSQQQDDRQVTDDPIIHHHLSIPKPIGLKSIGPRIKVSNRGMAPNDVQAERERRTFETHGSPKSDYSKSLDFFGNLPIEITSIRATSYLVVQLRSCSSQ